MARNNTPYVLLLALVCVVAGLVAGAMFGVPGMASRAGAPAPVSAVPVVDPAEAAATQAATTPADATDTAEPREATGTEPQVEVPPGLAEDDCGVEVLTSQRDVGGNFGVPGMAPVDAVKPGFAVQVQDEVIPYGLMAISVMPGETVSFEAVFTEPASELEVSAEAGKITRVGKDSWLWKAPDEVGSWCLTVYDTATDDSLCLQAFVMQPYDGQEVLNGYRIGSYQSRPLRGLKEYQMPEGLIEVTEENADTWVSPHFRLRQFLCKQESDFPKYLVLRTRLLLKLEMLLERVRERGIDAETFHVMSGYRTPWYNASIGNRTIYSRHAYGDAADIFIDLDRDGWMDEITGDGSVTTAEARWLSRLVEDAYGETWYMPFVGGLGIYGPASHRGPFIHVDTRGYRARW